MMRWAKGHEKCKSCGTTAHKHKARGLCASCYEAAANKRHKSHITRGTRLLTVPITKEDLEQKYQSGLSLGDIAREYNCTRQYISKLMRENKIACRTMSEARALAIQQGKLSYTSDIFNSGKTITHEKRYVNEAFFKTWTPAMAWVLGVIYTDGCLNRLSNSKTLRVTIGQKEPELLEKVRALMGSNSLIRYNPARGIAGALHEMSIYNVEISKDLQNLGLTERKSLTLKFPEIPPDFVRHFIRGCWDGDGSVSFLFNTYPPSASYVSGSKDFIEQLVRHLVALGLPDQTISKSTRSKNPSYELRYWRIPCVKLYHVLYDGVDENVYLKRKYDRFKLIADYLDSKGAQELRAANAALRNELKTYTHSKSPKNEKED